jgi:RNA polymerase sigma-70 factor (family 1)
VEPLTKPGLSNANMPEKEPTDEELVLLLKGNDSSAFEAIYRRYWRQLYVFVYQQIGSKEDTKEIIQELMLSLWQNRQVSTIQNLRAFLFIAARNQANKYFRKEINLRKYREHQLMQEVFESMDTDEIFNERQLSVAIEKALERLPEKTAIIFRMNKLDNLPVKKIATQMGLSDRAVEYHLTKSMRVVRKHLERFLSDN